MLDVIRFYCVRPILLVVTVVCVRAKVSVFRRISEDVAMCVIVKGRLFEFICHGHTKNGVFCEWCQYWFEFNAI